MFSNSKMSKIDPRGGISIFQISLKFKKSKISDWGGAGGQAYFGKTQKFSRFLIMRSPLTQSFWGILLLLMLSFMLLLFRFYHNYSTSIQDTFVKRGLFLGGTILSILKGVYCFFFNFKGSYREMDNKRYTKWSKINP